MNRINATCMGSIALIVAACTINEGRAAAVYSVINIGVPQGYTAFSAGDINSAGVVSGTSPVGGGGNTLGFLWTPSAMGGGSFAPVPSGLGAPSWNYTSGINDAGQVAGGGWLGPAFIWNTTNNTITPLPDPNGPNGSEGTHAYGINARGAVVGNGWDFYGGGGYRSFLWQPDTPNGSTGTMVSLGGGGGSDVTPGDINDSGHITGSRSGQGGFLWKPSTPNGTAGTFYPLDPLPGDLAAEGRGINNAGQIIGASYRGGSFYRAFLWMPTEPNGTTGTTIDLGSLPTANEISFPNDIDSAGTVVGFTGGPAVTNDQIRAFIWTSAEGMIDLNTLLDASGEGWLLQSATAINDAGQIVGSGLYDPDGPGGAEPTRRSFLLTPVPEPSCGLLNAAFAGLLCRRRCGRSFAARGL